MTDVADIAGRLTKAQEKRLVSVHALKRQGLSWASRYGSLRANTSRATTAALTEAGLLCVIDGDCDLTRLGVQVAAHIQGNSHD